MGIYAAENILIYIIVPFCIYLVYLYYNPVIKECQYCESDGYFHTCKPNTGATGPWCQKFNDADVFFVALAKRTILLLRNALQYKYYNVIMYIKLLPVAVELLVRLLLFRPGLGVFMEALKLINLPSCGVKLGRIKVDLCHAINKIFDKLADLINGGLAELLSSVISAIITQIGKGLKKILAVLFKGLKHLFRIVKVVFSIVIDGLKQVKEKLGNIYGIVSQLQIMSVFQSIFIIVIGIMAPGVMASYVVAAVVLLIIFAIPLGGIIGATHYLLYTTLMSINFVYNVFDLDVRDSKIIRLLEGIL